MSTDLYSQDYEFTKTRRGLTPLPEPVLTGMKLEKDIILNSFIFNSIDEYGVTWVVTDIDGWWSTPEVEVPSISRGYGDGEYDVQGKYRARIFTITGVFLTPDPSLVEDARDRLIKATDLVYKGAWLITGKKSVRASFVRLEGQVSTTTVTARGRTEFEIPLKAVDPIKYEWNSSNSEGYFISEINVKNILNPLSGKLFITNKGNYPVPVYLEVFGPIVGPATVHNKTNDELIIITSSLTGSKGQTIENKQLTFDRDSFKDIATLTTTAKHNFSEGREVTISGVGTEFDGTYDIISIPTSTTFTYEPEMRSTVKAVIYKTLANNVATIDIEGTLDTAVFSVGSKIFIKDVDNVFNGSYTILSRTSTSISYTKQRSTSINVTGSILENNQATLTTISPHNFILGESVTVSGIDSANYNGTFTINDIPTDNKFSYAKSRTDSKKISNISMSNRVVTVSTAPINHGGVVEEKIQISGLPTAAVGLNGSYTIASVASATALRYNLKRSTDKSVVSKTASGGVATLITSSDHGLNPGQSVIVENVDATFNGSYDVTSVPSPRAFTYSKSGTILPTVVVAGSVSISRFYISNVSLIGNVATLSTYGNHGIVVGESVTVSSIDTTFNGTYIVTAASGNEFSYTKVSSNVSSRAVAATISKFSRTGTTVTLTTASSHGYSAGNSVLVQGLSESTLVGLFTLISASGTTLTYTSSTSGTLAEADAPQGSFILAGRVTLSGNVPSTNMSVNDVAFINFTGSLPFRSSNGTATVSPNISRTFTGGTVVKENNIPFTPGVTNDLNTATALTTPDILEIDTLNREVFLNGESYGARGKIDVLADFIKLEPGVNEIEFQDSGTPESDSLLRVSYRSGWLS